jgi:hypothetical protein
MRIVQNYDKETIAQIALMCGDSNYTDFTEGIYAQACFRAQRDVAKTYDILKRTIELISNNDLLEEILIRDLKVEYEVKVNGEIFLKKTSFDPDEDTYKYELIYDPVNRLYSIIYTGKKDGDVISISYTSIGLTSEESDGIPVIPEQYEEELLEAATLYMAKLGIAKFIDEKKAKYQDLYRIYNRRQYDSRIAKDNSWIEVKPFRYP